MYGFMHGFIDAHSHLIPGIDDGCDTLEDSLQCVRNLIEYGFQGTICTPHTCVGAYPEITPPFIEERVDQLRQALLEAGLNYRLWSGAEVRIDPATNDWFREYGVPTLGDGHCVLIDYWDDQWQTFCDETVEYLFAHEYQPILAHPERMNVPDDELDRLVARLQDRGVWLQGNLRCIAGGEGAIPRDRMNRWLSEDRYQLIATDMHHPDCLGIRLEGIHQVRQQVGEEKLQVLLHSQLLEILGSSRPAR